jgi:hypothetical protein
MKTSQLWQRSRKVRWAIVVSIASATAIGPLFAGGDPARSLRVETSAGAEEFDLAASRNFDAAWSDLSSPSCRYIVLYSPTCPACRRLSNTWRGLWDADASPLPPTWRLVFVTEAELPDIDPVAAKGFPFRTNPLLSRSEWERFLKFVGLNAVPSHIILDKNGKLLETEIGAALWRSTQYADDCTIRHEAVSK